MKSLGRWITDTLLQSSIMEQAVRRSKFCDRVVSQADNVIENWCMIRWAGMSGDERPTRCIDHWKSELITAMLPLCNCKLVKGMDKRSAVEDAIGEMFGNYHKDRDEAFEYIYNIIQTKMEKEKCHINYDNHDEVESLVNDFINEIDIIFGFIIKSDVDGMKKYIRLL